MDDYGDTWADVYDELHRFLDPTPAVALLADLAGRGPALEIGIGTGRVALPLSAAGVDVHGIDVSEEMLRTLGEKPGAERLTVVAADAASFELPARYSLSYAVFNTLFSLPTQDAQASCFQRVAAHLDPEGLFVVEAYVPDPRRWDRDQSVRVVDVEPDTVRLSMSVVDRVAQTIRSQLVLVSESGLRLLPIYQRYAWPSELDLMARLAGLSLRERWGGWRREPFDASSSEHVSVYEKS